MDDPTEAPAQHVHTFPVPPGWTDDEAWEWLCQGLLLPTTDEPAHWTNYMCDGEECSRMFDREEATGG